MNDMGVFDPIVNALIKRAGNSVTAVMLATAAIAIIGHLDGSGATTIIITITAMLPIFKKLNLDKRTLMLITCFAIGVMNILPWGGSCLRAATVLGVEATVLWHKLIPVQILFLILAFVMAFILSRLEKRRLKKIVLSESTSSDTAIAKDECSNIPKWKRIFNFLLTIGIIAALMSGKFSSAYCFMVGLSIALTINLPNLKEQNAKLKEYGVAAINMVVTLFGAGVFTGILSNTGILDSMASAIVMVIPAGLGPFTHIIVACFSVPLIMCLGTDSFYYGLLPVVISICSNFGVDPQAVACVFLIAENIGVMISPMTAATYLGLGMLDLDIGEHIRYCLPWLWPISILSVLACILLGIVPM